MSRATGRTFQERPVSIEGSVEKKEETTGEEPRGKGEEVSPVRGVLRELMSLILRL